MTPRDASLPAPQTRLRYEDAGVSIGRGDALVEALKPHAARSARAGVMGTLGGFGSLFDMKALGMRDPVLVSGTDGVGTKLLVAIEAGAVNPALHDGIGQDCVAMCANDILCQGAQPLFFLDYFATGGLDVALATRVVAGIARACEAVGCALVGGETAEMPGLYAAGHYDLAGFCVGAVERDALLPRADAIAVGDAVIGVASSGAHSNGFSLLRRLVADQGLAWHDPSPFSEGETLAEALMTPTALYVTAGRAAMDAAGDGVRAMAHITGGGLPGNLPRVLADGLGARLDPTAWMRPPVFDWVLRTGRVAEDEAYRTFNMGLGLCLVAAPDAAQAVVDAFAAAGHEAMRVGEIVEASGADRVRFG